MDSVAQKRRKSKGRDLTPAEVVALLAALQRQQWGRRARATKTLRLRGGVS